MAVVSLAVAPITQGFAACADNLYADDAPCDVCEPFTYFNTENTICWKILSWTKQRCVFGWWYEGLYCDSVGSPSYTQVQKTGTVGWILGIKYCTNYGQPYEVTIGQAHAADC